MAAAKKKPQKRGTRKSTLKSKTAKRSAPTSGVVKLWVKRIAVACVTCIAVLWIGAWFFLSQADTQSAHWITTNLYAATVSAGFKVENINVEGRKYTESDALMAVINIGTGDPIFSFDPHSAREQIEKISWVKSVQVQRRLPDTIYIKLEERIPAALWKEDEKLVLIDQNGIALTHEGLERFKSLMMVGGNGANIQAPKLIGLLNAEDALKTLVDHAKLIDERRWNLYLKDGKTIELPEKDVGFAMRALMKTHESDNILSKDIITSINARYPGRLIVKTKLGKAQDYKTDTDNAGTQL